MLCFCVSAAFAQRPFRRAGFTKRAACRPACETKIQHQIEHVTRTPSHIQIVNLPQAPLVRVQTPRLGEKEILSARLLNNKQATPQMFPGGAGAMSLFIPPVLNSPEPVGYRGLPLSNTEELKNILENGLETKRTIEGKIFFSGWLPTALRFSQVSKEKIVTLIQFRVPEDALLYEYNDNYYTQQDIPASYIKQVVVFLEVDAEAGWYKVTLENGDLVFTALPGQVFKHAELHEHIFEVPFERQESWW